MIRTSREGLGVGSAARAVSGCYPARRTSTGARVLRGGRGVARERRALRRHQHSYTDMIARDRARSLGGDHGRRRVRDARVGIRGTGRPEGRHARRLHSLGDRKGPESRCRATSGRALDRRAFEAAGFGDHREEARSAAAGAPGPSRPQRIPCRWACSQRASREPVAGNYPTIIYLGGKYLVPRTYRGSGSLKIESASGRHTSPPGVQQRTCAVRRRCSFAGPLQKAVSKRAHETAARHPR